MCWQTLHLLLIWGAEFPFTLNRAGRSYTIGKCNSIFPRSSSAGTAVFPSPHVDRQWCPRDYLLEQNQQVSSNLLHLTFVCSQFKGEREFGVGCCCFSVFFFVFSLTSSILCIFLEAKSCEDIQCSAGKKCLWDFKVGRGRCALCDEVCPESKSDEAVCASDNTTYPSECAMKEAACSMGVLLEVKHSGSCNCK